VARRKPASARKGCIRVCHATRLSSRESVRGRAWLALWRAGC
jgi:hypothetical protein